MKTTTAALLLLALAAAAPAAAPPWYLRTCPPISPDNVVLYRMQLNKLRVAIEIIEYKLATARAEAGTDDAEKLGAMVKEDSKQRIYLTESREACLKRGRMYHLVRGQKEIAARFRREILRLEYQLSISPPAPNSPHR
jgi:hypothetical protein